MHMTFLIAAVLFGLAFAFFATQNTTGVTLRFYDVVWTGVPLYLIALGSLLVGFIIAWIISLFDWAATTLTVYDKDHSIRKRERVINDLSHRINELEIENAKLRGNDTEAVIHEPSIEKTPTHRPSFFDRFRRPRFSL